MASALATAPCCSSWPRCRGQGCTSASQLPPPGPPRPPLSAWAIGHPPRQGPAVNPGRAGDTACPARVAGSAGMRPGRAAVGPWGGLGATQACQRRVRGVRRGGGCGAAGREGGRGRRGRARGAWAEKELRPGPTDLPTCLPRGPTCASSRPQPGNPGDPRERTCSGKSRLLTSPARASEEEGDPRIRPAA